MLRVRPALLGGIGLATWLATLTPVAVAWSARRPQSLSFDAMCTRDRPDRDPSTLVISRSPAESCAPPLVGKRAGSRSPARGKSTRPDGAVESCAASAWTADGRLDAAGPARSSSLTHHWRITGGTGAYRDADGSVLVRDLGDGESLISATVTSPRGSVLHAGRLSHPAANLGLIARADGLCRKAAQQLNGTGCERRARPSRARRRRAGLRQERPRQRRRLPGHRHHRRGVRRHPMRVLSDPYCGASARPRGSSAREPGGALEPSTPHDSNNLRLPTPAWPTLLAAERRLMRLTDLARHP